MFKKWLIVGGFGGLSLFCLLGAKNPVDQKKDIDAEYIRQRVTQAIVAQAHQPKSTTKHKRHKYMCRGAACTQGAIYLLPHWPYYTQFFEDNDLVQVSLAFDTASQAYAGNGGSRNLYKLIFGEPPILGQEILLVSKLVAQNPAVLQIGGRPNATTPFANDPLRVLATQEIKMHASLDQYYANIDYARHFRNGDLTIGFHIPIKMRHQRLSIKNDYDAQKKQNIETFQNDPNTYWPTFLSDYPTLESFVTEVLHRKGMSFNKKETVLGFGDVVAYANLDIKSSYFQRFVPGISLLLPTAREVDTGKLWDACLGNGGFIQLAGYASFLWQSARWFNPYVHFKATYSFAANVNRRVPMINSYDGSNLFNNTTTISPGQPVRGLMVFGEKYALFASNPAPLPPALPGVPFAVIDSTVRGFADQTKKVKIEPGAEFFCRIGNTFDAIFSYKGFVDIFYDLKVKGKDYVVHRPTDDVFVPSVLTHNSHSVSNAINISYSYQFDAQYRARLGMGYIFAGRNAPQAFGMELSLNAEF